MIKKHIRIYKSISIKFFLLFFFGFVSAACSPDMTTGSVAQLPGSNQSAGACRSNAALPSPQWYNNKNQIIGNNALLFLEMIGLSPTLSCNATLVKNIQTQMQKLGGGCSACIDGKAGTVTRDNMNNCATLACTGTNKTPTMTNNILTCTTGYELSNLTPKCCVAKVCTGRDKTGYVNGVCPSGFIGDGDGCCELNNISHQTTITAYPVEFGDLNTAINVLVEFGSGVDSGTSICQNIEIINTDTGLVRNGDKGIDQNLDCSTTIKAKEFKDIKIISPAGIVKYIDGNDSIYAEKIIKSLITGCALPQIITGGKCQCPNGAVLNNGACCTTASPEVCSCAGGKKWNGNACVCPDGKKENQEGKCVCDSSQGCCGIKLNTVVPFIGDCIEMTSQNNTSSSNNPNSSTVNQLNAFPFLMMGLSKILVTVILIFSFLIIIAAGFMMTTGVYSDGNYKKGIEMIEKVVIALILLGSSGLILRLINPSFFGG